MANFDRLAELGRAHFLRYDQAEMVQRFRLESDTEYIYVNYLGVRWRIDRQTAAVWKADGSAAAPSASLSIYDMLCKASQPKPLSGTWRTTNMLPGTAQSSPNDEALLRPWAERFTQDPERLRGACIAHGGEPFPIGDIAYTFKVFDGFPVVLQFFLGDEEFPSSLRFLWDAHTLSWLRYETLYYIMDDLLRMLAA
ncbi:MAG: DUF3786 domain-containing protein [Oscillospiraceae bacterium]|nr:DUF3786 domain-containing protein [Oscillospiraceae bacterium]